MGLRRHRAARRPEGIAAKARQFLRERSVNFAEMLVEMRRVGRLFVKNDQFAHADDSLETGRLPRGRAMDGLLYTSCRRISSRYRAASYQCVVKAGAFIS